MDLITVKDDIFRNNYRNALTEELDKHVLKEHLPSIEYGGGTYLEGHIEDEHMSIRFPGATRGGIFFNTDLIITDIIMYDDNEAKKCQCYDNEIYTLVKKYIGSKLIFEGEEDG